MRFQSRRRKGVSSIIGSIFFVLIMIVSIASLVTIFNSFTSYNYQVNKASNSNLQAAGTQLSVTGSQFGAFPPSTTSNFNVASNSNTCNAQATFPTNRPKLEFASGMWWDFFTCNSAYQYSTSFDGVTWQTPTAIPNLVAGYTVGPDFDVELVGTTFYLAIAKVGATDFQFGIGTLTAGGTNAAPAGTIAWTSLPAQVTTVVGSNAVGPINMAIDSTGNQWVAIVVGAYAIAVYERQACASGTSAANGWEPNACSSSANPGNNAPASFAGLSANVHTIFEPAPSTLSPTGVILMYESGSATNPSTGALVLVTQASLNTAAAAWNSITLTSVQDYSLTSSSALFIGNTMYFVGLANAAAGAIIGTLRFWTISFTSMTVATNTADTTGIIESTATVSWQAALTSSGTTLVLFDSPSSSTIQYYTSSTLGSIWSSAITLESAESAVSGLCPSDYGFAITWTGAGASFNVRFAALSAFTVSNASPFAVHLVDLYIYNPATNSLVAHYYYNSTEDFDYYVGQGSSMVLPIRFIWAATTSYLVTVGTDAGVTTHLTVSSPPVPTTTCPAGSFISQIAPAQTCAGELADEAPAVAFTSNANTCTDTTSGTSLMMGLGATYTTRASSSGGIYVVLTFNVASPATSNLNSKWQLVYGTGSAPACNAAATGTIIGEQYTINTEAAVTLGASQSVGVTITGLTANTAYWFDVQASDSSVGAWVYSLPSLSVTEILTSGDQTPELGYSSNTNTCTISSAVASMGGLGTTYTTGTSASGFSGNLYVTLSLGVASPATSGVNSLWRIAYGTGAAPACGVGSTGTAVGNQYQVATEAAVVLAMGQSESAVIPNLTPATTYWFDVQISDSSAGSWIFSNPTLAVAQMPTAAGLSPNVNFASNANSCGRNTAANGMAGFGITYTSLSSSTGSIFAALTFKVAGPATASLNSKWQVVYGTGAAPACNAAATGTTVGRQYTIDTETAVAGGMGQTIGFVLSGLSKGTQYWFDVQATDSSVGVWTYSNSALSVIDIMPADYVHSNTILASNANSCGRNTAANGMAGFATSYTTTSYGEGNLEVVMTFTLLYPITNALTTAWQIAYGTGAAPACNAASTGTTVGNLYTDVASIGNGAPGPLQISQSEGVTIVGLTPGTTYWFDVQATDSSVVVWTYSNPQISVVEIP